MLTLVHAPRSRSSRFIWLLEELGAPYEIKLASIRRGDGSGAADAANPHPHGKVPALIHDGVTIFESAAIALYLTDAFPEKELGPRIGDKLRGPYLTWLAYYTGVLEPAFVSKFMNVEVPRGTAGWVNADEAMAPVTAALESGPYLLGETFSAADILYGSTFALFLGNPLLPETPTLRAYVDRCASRPAHARAAAKDGG
jgi:glutathione S-transferase